MPDREESVWMRTPPSPSSAVEHLGELIRPGKYGHHLTREIYAQVNKKSSTKIPKDMLTDELRALLAPHYEDAELTIHTDMFCRRHREMALENFDLNMALLRPDPPRVIRRHPGGDAAEE